MGTGAAISSRPVRAALVTIRAAFKGRPDAFGPATGRGQNTRRRVPDVTGQSRQPALTTEKSNDLRQTPPEL